MRSARSGGPASRRDIDVEAESLYLGAQALTKIRRKGLTRQERQDLLRQLREPSLVLKQAPISDRRRTDTRRRLQQAGAVAQ